MLQYSKQHSSVLKENITICIKIMIKQNSPQKVILLNSSSKTELKDILTIWAVLKKTMALQRHSIL